MVVGKALEAKIDRPAGVVRWVTGPGPCWLPASACQTNPLPDNKHAHACMHAHAQARAHSLTPTS